MVKPPPAHATRHRILNTSTCPQPFRHKALTSSNAASTTKDRPSHTQHQAEAGGKVKKENITTLWEVEEEEEDGVTQECKQCKVYYI